MPYITREQRLRLIGDQPENSGELNYEFTKRINLFLRGRKLSYQLINDVLGALEGCKQEFYRRVAVPYEKKKMKRNGDVY